MAVSRSAGLQFESDRGSHHLFSSKRSADCVLGLAFKEPSNVPIQQTRLACKKVTSEVNGFLTLFDRGRRKVWLLQYSKPPHLCSAAPKVQP
jgi:hypothetical protein